MERGMNRREFTKNMAKLITQMVADGHEPIADFLLRSAEEQKRLFDAGLSKCDGVKKPSRHQYGRAVDIYFFINGDVDFSYVRTAELAKKYHELWVSWGGKPMIEWDQPHYEG
jgi:hypothetical protein